MITDENSQKHLIQENNPSDSYITSEVSNTTIDEEKPVLQLKDYGERNFFLRRVAFYFLLYFAIAFGVVFFLKFDARSSRMVYRYLRIDKYFMIVLWCSLGVKLVFGFFSKWLSWVSLPFFIMDCVALFFICFGLWFYFEENQRAYSISQGFWVTVAFFNLFTFFFAFLISTWFPGMKGKYNYQFATPWLILVSLVTIKLIDMFWLVEPMNVHQFMIVVFCFVILTFYVAINSFMVVTFRASKYKEDEALRCYWGYWVDWFSFFWYDFFANLKFVQKKIKKADKKKRRKDKKKRKDKHLKEKLKALELQRQKENELNPAFKKDPENPVPLQTFYMFNNTQ